MTIISKPINGLFEAGVTPFVSVTETQFKVEIAPCKDPVFLIIDLTGASANTLTVLDENGASAKEIPLTGDELNIVPVTTYGLIADGGMSFKLANAGVKLAAVAYTPVINH